MATPATTPLTRDESPAGETAVGQVVADAQLAATRGAADGGAQIAFMNPGGLRANLTAGADGAVRYEDLFSVQPFYNNLVTMTLSGEQLVQLLEQQWRNQPAARLMQVSRGFSYTWDAARPVGQRVVVESVRLNGQAISADSQLRVTVNAFMASGGDNFNVLRSGSDQRTGMMDVDAFELYIKNNPGLLPGKLDRIARLN